MKKLFLILILLPLLCCCRNKEQAEVKVEPVKEEAKFNFMNEYSKPGIEYLAAVNIREELPKEELQEIFDYFYEKADAPITVVEFFLYDRHGVWLEISCKSGITTYKYHDCYDMSQYQLSNIEIALNMKWYEKLDEGKSYEKTIFYEIHQRGESFIFVSVFEGEVIDKFEVKYEGGKFYHVDSAYENGSYFIINNESEFCYYWDFDLLYKYSSILNMKKKRSDEK